MSKTKLSKKEVIEASGIAVKCSHDDIIGIEKLVPNPRNPNQHGEQQIALLAKVIKHQGWRNPIVVSNRSGFIVKGHGRYQAAQLLEVESVPVDKQDYESEAEEWADMIADNRIAELAEIDRSSLKDLLEELDTGDIDLELTGFDKAALEELMSAAPPEFPEYDESAGDEIEKIKCPKCGHNFPK